MPASAAFKTFCSAVATALVATLPTMGLAQDLPTRDAVEPGGLFLAETHRDWTVRCVRGPNDDTPDRCEMTQLLQEENGNPVVEFRLTAPAAMPDNLVAMATFATPLETLLTPGIRMVVDDNPEFTLPFSFCTPQACIVQIGLSEQDLELFRNGADASVTLYALTRDQGGAIGGIEVPTAASLRGFTAALDDLFARREDIRAFLAAQPAGDAAPSE